MGEQLAYRDIALERFQLTPGPINPECPECWNPVMRSIVELKFPSFQQGHQCHTGNRLGHRVNTEYGIGTHRRLRGYVHVTMG